MCNGSLLSLMQVVDESFGVNNFLKVRVAIWLEVVPFKNLCLYFLDLWTVLWNNFLDLFLDFFFDFSLFGLSLWKLCFLLVILLGICVNLVFLLAFNGLLINFNIDLKLILAIINVGVHFNVFLSLLRLLGF